MLRPQCKLGLLWLWMLASAGFQQQYPPVELDTRGVVPAAGCEELAGVLAAAVTRSGRLNLAALKRQSAALDRQLRRMAVTGPTASPALLPTPEHAIAYWYNARAAWSMKLLLVEGCPKEVRRDSLLGRQFPLDGRPMCLAGIDEVLAKDKDFRTAVAVPGATTEDARLPRKPFVAEGIRRQIAERFAAFIDDKTRFVIDVREQQVLVPPALWRFRDRLTRAYDTRYGTEGATLITALLAYLTGSPLRRLQDAIGYQAVEADSPYLVVATEDP
jgi:hypothetical protein